MWLTWIWNVNAIEPKYWSIFFNPWTIFKTILFDRLIVFYKEKTNVIFNKTPPSSIISWNCVGRLRVNGEIQKDCLHFSLCSKRTILFLSLFNIVMLWLLISLSFCAYFGGFTHCDYCNSFYLDPLTVQSRDYCTNQSFNKLAELPLFWPHFIRLFW